MLNKMVLSVSTTLLLITAFSSVSVQAQTSSVFVTGLKAPAKIIYSHAQRVFLVSEAGVSTIPNSGRISIITNEGERFTLIDGLPSGVAPPSNDPAGPSALTTHGNKIYILLGPGNSTIVGPGAGSEIPNPNPNAPIFSSVLELRLPVGRFRFNRTNYNLTPADYPRLKNGETLTIGTGAERGTLRLIADFPDFTPSFRPDVPNNVRPSNPFGLALHGNFLYVADAAQNTLQTVDLEDGRVAPLFDYPARPNPLAPMGPPFIDAVPDSLRLFGNKLLVTFLTGFPFPAGLADVRQYDLGSGEESRVIGGLRSAIDVLPVDQGGFCSSFYTLEFSSNMLAGAPGRLQRYDTPTGTPTVISSTLISPTSMARHPASGDILVTEIFPGRITRIAVQ